MLAAEAADSTIATTPITPASVSQLPPHKAEIFTFGGSVDVVANRERGLVGNIYEAVRSGTRLASFDVWLQATYKATTLTFYVLEQTSPASSRYIIKWAKQIPYSWGGRGSTNYPQPDGGHALGDKGARDARRAVPGSGGWFNSGPILDVDHGEAMGLRLTEGAYYSLMVGFTTITYYQGKETGCPGNTPDNNPLKPRRWAYRPYYCRRGSSGGGSGGGSVSCGLDDDCLDFDW